MASIELRRIAELWPSLDDDARRSLTDIAEGIVTTPSRLVLTVVERQALERARDDFKNGRSLSPDDYKREMDTFLDALPRKA